MMEYALCYGVIGSYLFMYFLGLENGKARRFNWKMVFPIVIAAVAWPLVILWIFAMGFIEFLSSYD